ncbi:MAG: hypothetical protein WAO71_11755 [Gallionella sp.]
MMNRITIVKPRKFTAKVLWCALGLTGMISGGNAKGYDARPEPVVHVNIQPPTPSNKPFEIFPPTKSLLADGVVADASPNQGILVAAAQVKYDVAYSICQTVAPVGGADYPVANAIYPTMAAGKYFDDRGIHTEGSDLPKVTLIDAPKHGELQHGDVDWVYLYKPNKDYLGSDRMIFSVEVKGKVFKVIYSVDVVQVPGNGSPSCPNSIGIKELKNSAAGRNKHGSLDIWELPSATQFDVETLAQMHSAIGFGLEDMGLSNANVTFADLAGAAIGQTTGPNITLDTNAAGNGWFVDSTPADNSEFLPTSNPNEWIAKAGTAANATLTNGFPQRRRWSVV